MAALPWMLFQTGVTGYLLYRETVEAQALGRAPEPLPVFILGSLGVLAAAALAQGLADVVRSRRRRDARSGAAPGGTVTRRGRAGKTGASDADPA